jgi:hypothetical protein
MLDDEKSVEDIERIIRAFKGPSANVVIAPRTAAGAQPGTV